MKERERTRRHRRSRPRHKELPQNPESTLVQPRGSSRFRRNAVLLTALSTAALVALSLEYPLHQIELVSSYGKDFIGPLFAWSSLQLLSLNFPKLENWAKSIRPLIPYSTYALGMELFQYQFADVQEQLNLPGRYDPWDLAALGAGTAFALAANRFILQRK